MLVLRQLPGTLNVPQPFWGACWLVPPLSAEKIASRH
jgi:hypothetical protein